MIQLRGRSVSHQLRSPLVTDLWPLVKGGYLSTTVTSRTAYLVSGDEEIPNGFGLYVVRSGIDLNADQLKNIIELSEDFNYLESGDVIAVSGDGTHVQTLWRCSSDQNSILLTEQCDNYCI